MKILLIITPFYPSQTPNTLRWIPIINYFKNKGIETVVLTTKNRSYGHKNFNAASIYEVGYNTLLDWLYFTFRINRRRHLPNNSKGNFAIKLSRLNGIIQLILDHTWRKYYWPDGSRLFLKAGIKEARNIISNDKNISHIISVGLPFTCHLIASKTKEVFPHLHWHQDIEDPFCYSNEFWVNNFNIYRKKNIQAELKAFKLSDSISVTNPKAKEIYANIFQVYAHKLSVIYPMFPEYNTDNFKGLELDVEKIHIGYFGSFYYHVRSPETLLNLLDVIRKEYPNRFKNFHFHFFGQQNRFSSPIFESFKGLENHIILHGFKDRDYSISAMKQMDFLINIGNTTDYHLPSKVVDFLYMNKPLIQISTSEQDASLVFLKNKIPICNINKTNNGLHKMADKMLSFILKQHIQNDVSDNNISDYTTTAIAEKYLELM